MVSQPDAQRGADVGIQWADDAQGVTTSTATRHVRFLRLSVEEVDDLKSSNSSLELALFGICFGTLITLVVTVRTVALPESDRILFVALSFMFGIASVYLLAVTVRAERRWRKRIEGLKKMARID